MLYSSPSDPPDEADAPFLHAAERCDLGRYDALVMPTMPYSSRCAPSLHSPASGEG